MKDTGTKKKRKRLARRKATSTAIEARTAMFVPTDKTSYVNRYPVGRGDWIITRYGRIRKISGCGCTQSHQDLLEALTAFPGRMTVGGWQVTFTQADLRHELGSRVNNWNRVEEKLKELFHTTFEVEDLSRGFSLKFHIVNEIGAFEDEASARTWIDKNTSKRHIEILRADRGRAKSRRYTLCLSRRYMQLYEEDLTLDYKRYRRLIAQLRHALSKTVARGIIGHDNVNGWKLKTVLQSKGALTDAKGIRQAVSALTDEHDIELLSEMGIRLKRDADGIPRLYYRRNSGEVFIETPGGRDRHGISDEVTHPHGWYN